MNYSAQNIFRGQLYRRQLFYRSFLESAPRPKLSPPDVHARAMRPASLTQTQLHQLKRKLLRAALEESGGEVGLFKQLCGAARQADELAWNESYPLLIFPCLFEELAQLAREEFDRDKPGELANSLAS